jgi:DNA-binding MarR family transcriptional regulator
MRDDDQMARARLASRNALYEFFIAGQAVRRLLAEAFRGAPLTQEEWAVMSTIGSSASLTPTELGARLSMPPTTVSTHLRRLLERGLVEQSPHPTDGRSWLVHASAAGRRALEETRPHYVAALSVLRRQLRVPEAKISAALAELTRAATAAVDDL